jgi:hypothetical protein
MHDQPPLASHVHYAARLDDTLEFLKRTRSELRSLHKVQVWPDRLRVFDVNGDCFEVCGLGYAHAEIVRVLQSIGTAFNPETIHRPAVGQYKEFRTSRRHPWAEDRVM